MSEKPGHKTQFAIESATISPRKKIALDDIFRIRFQNLTSLRHNNKVQVFSKTQMIIACMLVWGPDGKVNLEIPRSILYANDPRNMLSYLKKFIVPKLDTKLMRFLDSQEPVIGIAGDECQILSHHETLNTLFSTFLYGMPVAQTPMTPFEKANGKIMIGGSMPVYDAADIDAIVDGIISDPNIVGSTANIIESAPHFSNSIYEPPSDRYVVPVQEESQYSYMDFSLSSSGRILYKNDPATFEETSQKLMALFMVAAKEAFGQPVTREQLRTALQRNVADVTISTYVGRLRNHLEYKYPDSQVVLDTVGHNGWRLVSKDILSHPHVPLTVYRSSHPEKVEYRGFVYSDATEDVFYGTHALNLTLPGRKLMICLLRAEGEKVSLNDLLTAVYTMDNKANSYGLWQHIRKLRKKMNVVFGQDNGLIETKKESYRLAVEKLPTPKVPQLGVIYAQDRFKAANE